MEVQQEEGKPGVIPGDVEQGWEKREGEKAIQPRALAFIKCFCGPGAKHMGFSFNPDSILKEEHCLLIYYLFPPSLLECKLLGSGGYLFCSPLWSNIRKAHR